MKTALTIDGNYLLHKDVFILHGMKSLHEDLEDLLRLDIDKLSKMYPFDSTYFASDSKTKTYWRKEFFTDYKSTRKPDINIDWDWVYKVYDELIQEIRLNPNINQLQFDWVEGDDIIAYIVNKGNKLGYSNVIMAADSDLHQLVRFDLSNELINVVYNYKFSDERLYVPENYNVFFSEMKRNATSTLFDMNEDDEFLMFLEELIDRVKTVEVSDEKILFTKLIQGDKKDAIPSVYQKETTTGKMMGIGKAGAESIYNLYKETYNKPINFDSTEFIEKASEIISYSKKIENTDTISKIKNNIKKNLRLIKLTENYLPTEILNEFNKKIIIK